MLIWRVPQMFTFARFQAADRRWKQELRFAGWFGPRIASVKNNNEQGS
jgi:hypothetical protein